MKIVEVVVIVSLCIIITFLFSMYILNQGKEQEISILNEEINDLNTQLEQYTGNDNMFVGTWNLYLGDAYIYPDILYLHLNKTAGIDYGYNASSPCTYSIENGILSFKMGMESLSYIYSFHDNQTMILAEETLGKPMDTRAVYFRV